MKVEILLMLPAVLCICDALAIEEGTHTLDLNLALQRAAARPPSEARILAQEQKALRRTMRLNGTSKDERKEPNGETLLKTEEPKVVTVEKSKRESSTPMIKGNGSLVPAGRPKRSGGSYGGSSGGSSSRSSYSYGGSSRSAPAKSSGYGSSAPSRSRSYRSPARSSAPGSAARSSSYGGGSSRSSARFSRSAGYAAPV